MLVDNFPRLKNRDNEVPDACYKSFLKIAERGINAAAPGLKSKQKKDLQDLAISALYEKLDELENGEHMAKQLWTIARNKTIDFINSYEFKNSRSIQAIEEEAEIRGREISNEQLMNFDTAPDALIRKERHSQVNQALDLIGEPCKTILVEIYVNDWSYAAIANRFHMPNEDAVDNQVRKCKKIWKTIFAQISDIDYTTKEEEFAL